MRPLRLLTTLFAIGSAIALLVDPYPYRGRNLIPRVKGQEATQEHRGSDRSKGLNRDNARPGNRPANTKDQAEKAQRIIKEGRAAKLPEGDLRVYSTPQKGQSAYTYDEDTNIAKVYFGDGLDRASRHLDMREHFYGESGTLYQPRVRNAEERRAARHQRDDSYRTLPTDPEYVRDHKGPMSSHYAKDNQVATVVGDGARPQSLEGRLVSAANNHVIDNGYTDPTKKSTWKGKGGVMLIPNSRNEDPIEPEVGPPGSKPAKYSVNRDSEEDEITPRKRDRPSRSSSDDSYTLTNRPKRKTRKADDNQRRDIAGVGQIASTEATSSATGSKSGNSSNPTPEELQDYVDAWNIVKSNATDILWPFIVDMLEGTNSSLVITAAWSVYSHMLPTPYTVFGPFYYGMTSLESQEQIWAQSGNISNATLAELYAVDDVLIDLYSAAWDGGFEALNSTGILDDLDWLGRAITAYNISLPAEPIPSADAEDPYEEFFLSYFSIVPDDELDLNSTASYNSTASGTAAPSAALSSGTNTTLSTASLVPRGVGSLNKLVEV